MDDQTLLHHLEQLAEGLGVEVCYEAAGGRAGLCVLRGQKRAVIDHKLTVSARVEALAAVLTDCDIEGLYVPPAVRELLERPAQQA